jgi:hypothetical protein
MEKKNDLINANDLESLPVAFHADKKILLDAHECAPHHLKERIIWRIFLQFLKVYISKKHIPLADVMITMGTDLVNEYEKNFALKSTIIANCLHKELNPTPAVGTKIKLIHQETL